MLFEQIEQNKRKTLFVIIGFFLIVSSIGAVIQYIDHGQFLAGAVLAGFIAGIYIAVMYLNASLVVMKMNGATEVSNREQSPLLWDTVEQMAGVAEVPMPKVYIIDDPAINAFACGISPKESSVAVTSGLLDHLQQYEIEGVIAHEISHIKNYDIRLATIAIALVSCITFFSDISLRMMLRGKRKSSGSSNSKNAGALYIIAIVFIVLTPIMAVLLQYFLSRNREYLADASAVELTRNPDGLIAALDKISRHDKKLEKGSSASQSMYFSAFENKNAEEPNWFDTHPPISLRIERLRNM